MEQAIVSGVTYTTGRGQGHRARACPTNPAWPAGRLLGRWAAAHVNVDMIIQNVGEGGLSDISCTVPIDDLPRRRARRSTASWPSSAPKATRPTRRWPKLSLNREPACARTPAWPALMFPHACRQGHKPRDDLDVGDQGLLRDRQGPGSKKRCAPLHDAFDLESATVSHWRQCPTGGGNVSERGLHRRHRRRHRGGRGHPCAPSSRSAIFRSASCVWLASERSRGAAARLPRARPARSGELSGRRLRRGSTSPSLPPAAR